MNTSEFQIGKLYSYPNGRAVFFEPKGAAIAFTECNEPFVLLDIFDDVLDTEWNRSYKILTSQGIIGWVIITNPALIVEIKQ